MLTKFNNFLFLYFKYSNFTRLCMYVYLGLKLFNAVLYIYVGT